MVLLYLPAQTAAEDHDSTPIDLEQVDRIVGQLFTEIESLRRERDCLRSALVDAGFSLRAVRIAQYANETSAQPKGIGIEPLPGKGWVGS
jgi:hypothetical protein